jgi:Cys-tRNA(Pro)/Cys-tRNA(Cys) deacylase
MVSMAKKLDGETSAVHPSKSGKSDAAGATPATAALTAAAVPFQAHTYDHDPANTEFGAEAASVLGVDAEQVFKTLVADVDGALVVAVVPVTGMLNLKALAAAVGGKHAVMADPVVAERRTGYVVGGISPIGQRHRLVTVIDETAQLFDTIYVSGGHRGFDVELAPGDLLAVTGGTFAAIARD